MNPHARPCQDSRSTLHHYCTLEWICLLLSGRSWTQRQDPPTARDPAWDIIASLRPDLALLCDTQKRIAFPGTVQAQLSGRKSNI